MSVRRRNSRLQVLNADGVLRVWRDVTARRTEAGDYLVVSNEAGIQGERLTLYLARSTRRSIPVRIVESRPVVLDGVVRHELRLCPLEEPAFDPSATARDGDVEAE